MDPIEYDSRFVPYVTWPIGSFLGIDGFQQLDIPLYQLSLIVQFKADFRVKIIVSFQGEAPRFNKNQPTVPWRKVVVVSWFSPLQGGMGPSLQS